MLTKVLPIIAWGRSYTWALFLSDLLAAVIVSIMLIPQSLAYALLAGLPPEVGLYASILPLIFYSLFGSSRGLAVGPVAVISLMTAASIASIAEAGTIGYLEAAVALAFLSGVILFGMGLLRLGFLANFLSHPVISGFITASALIIAFSQAKHLLGVDVSGHNLLQIGGSLLSQLKSINGPTLVIGTLALGLLLSLRQWFKPLLIRLGMSQGLALSFSRTGPIWTILLTTLMVFGLNLDARGVATLGVIPEGLPSLTLPVYDADLWGKLLASAFLISLVGFVESVSVGQTMAAKRRESINPNQELIGLGAANIGAAISGGMPVSGGFSRTVVNVDAGAQTPIAGIFVAVGMAFSTVFFAPYLAMLPKATLGATIIVAVLPLIDIKILRQTWNYSKSDFLALVATILTTLIVSVEVGLSVGIALSITSYLRRTSQPHFAVVGLVPGTEHFRNIKRHEVIVSDRVLSLRVDGSLYFANARYLENCILQVIADKPAVKDLVLVCTAVNDIDSSALESLESIMRRLTSTGIRLHLSEVKGPVMDKLQRTDFVDKLTGKIFLTQFKAMQNLAPEVMAFGAN